MLSNNVALLAAYAAKHGIELTSDSDGSRVVYVVRTNKDGRVYANSLKPDDSMSDVDVMKSLDTLVTSAARLLNSL